MVDCESRTDTKMTCAEKRLDNVFQNLVIDLDTMMNTIGRTYMIISLTHKIFTLTINKIIIETPKIMRKVTTKTLWIC